MFYVTAGSVQVSAVSEQGKEGIIAALGSGTFLGEGCVAGQPVRMASAISTADNTVAIKIKKSAMNEALHDNVEFSELFTAYLLSRNIQIEEDLVDHLFNSSEKRLARTLIMLAHFGKDGTVEMVIPKVTQDVLAARVGTTRSRINFFMNKFRKLGFIEYNGSLKVHSALLNVVLHD